MGALNLSFHFCSGAISMAISCKRGHLNLRVLFFVGMAILAGTSEQDVAPNVKATSNPLMAQLDENHENIGTDGSDGDLNEQGMEEMVESDERDEDEDIEDEEHGEREEDEEDDEQDE